MKNTFKLTVMAGALVLGFASYQNALAAPVGAYTDLAGGVGYLAGAQLDHMDFPENTDGSFGNQNAVPYYSAKTNFTGRAAFGYFFNKDPLNSWAFGLEGGYDYLSPVNSNGSETFNSLGSAYTVNGAVQTSAWATDLDFVISEDISESVSLIYKLGAAYESMTRNFTATQTAQGPYGQPGAFNSTTNSDASGFGGLAGFGIQFNFTPHFGLRTEIDGMKGGNSIGYAQGTAGLVWAF